MRHAFDEAARPRVLAAGSGLAVAATLVSGSIAHAANFEVDTTADTTDSLCTAMDGDCSLRGAITQANLSPDSTITFASSVTGTITLGSPLPSMSAGETVTGPGAKILTIAGAGGSYVETDTDGGDVSISDLTIQGTGILGDAGSGTLRLVRMAVSGSTNGYGVDAASPLDVANSTINGNGVGVRAQAAFTMTNSTVTGSGSDGVQTSAGGVIDNSTVAGNGGHGVYNSGSLTLNSTIVAGSNFPDLGGTGSLNEYYSLVEDGSGSPSNATANLNGQDPKLGALADNGGPTQTMKPAADSPVLDKGKDFSGSGTDQRGDATFDDSSITNAADGRDVGAVEFTPPSVSSVTPSAGVAGTTVTITGTDFTGATDVEFGSTAATNFTVDSDTQITATAPAGSGTVDVTVATPDGTSPTSTNDQFQYVPAPVVSSITPDHGDSGTAVTITGSGLTHVTDVDFGSKSASFTVDSDTQITATAPAGNAGPVDVTVTNANSTSATSTADRFIYPATFVVDTNSDDASLDGCTTADDDCSLRGAIIAANDDPNSTITFAGDVNGTITLGSDLPELNAGETVDGPGAKALTIDASGTAPGGTATFPVDTSAGAVRISGLTIADSPAAAVDASAGPSDLTLSQMSVSGAKGGVSAQSTLHVIGTTISGATAAGGYAITAGAGLTVTNSTVTGSANGVGTTYATISNSTIAGNTGYGIHATGDLYLGSTIVAGDGTDVSLGSGGTVTENYSLIQDASGLTLESGSGHNLNGSDPALGPLADNRGPTPTMKPSLSSPVVDQGKNFTGSQEDQRGFGVVDAPGVANAADGRDIGAVELQAPAVASLSPNHGDAGTSVTITGTDFTGATAVKFGSVDATSFTVDSDTQITAVAPAGTRAPHVRVTTPLGTSAVSGNDLFGYPSSAFVVDTNSDDASLDTCDPDTANDCSLRGAIADSNVAPDSTITFASSVTGITLGSNLPTISAGQTIQGTGANQLSVSGGSSSSGRTVFTVSTAGGAVSISSLAITGSGSHDAVSSAGAARLTLTSDYVHGSRKRGVTASSPLTIDHSTISGNGKYINTTGPAAAAGVYASSGLTMTNSTVAGNRSKYDPTGDDGPTGQPAGGVGVTGGATIENSTISSNNKYGGFGIRADGAHPLVLHSTIVGDNAASDVTISGGGTLAENYSLIENTSATPDTSSDHNLNGQEPRLGPLGPHGGPMPTVLPDGSSPVIDQGKDYSGTGMDQRGVAIDDNPDVANAADARDMGAAEPHLPSVVSLSPTGGHQGDTVVITGRNFTAATSVTFGSATSSFTVDSATQITATVPSGSGQVDVTVATGEGTSRTVTSDQFHYLAPPTVTSLSPASGNEGDTVTITGTNLTGTTGVKFGTADATDVTVVDDQHVTAKAPAGSGDVDVTVTNSDGTSATSADDKFHYLAPPAVSSLSPASGNEGDTVTITGTNLTGTTGVKFGSADATDVTVVDDQHVTAKAPAGSGDVDVTVTNADGTSATSASDRFHYLAPPAVSSISPTQGSAGDTVTITGTNLTGTTGVKFGSADATDVTVVDDQHVTAKAPAGSGDVDVTVTTGDGTSATSAGDKFHYVAPPPVSTPPAVSSLSPAHGSAGDTVTITGTHLTGTTGVKFGSADATDVTVVDDQHVTAKAPAGSGTVDVAVTTGDGTSAPSAADRFTYDKPSGPVKPKHHLTDAQARKLLRRPLISDRFLVKPEDLLFTDRLPEAGHARYHLVLLKRGSKDKQSALGGQVDTNVESSGRITMRIDLSGRDWDVLRRHPRGRLVLRMSFRRKFNGHVLRINRTIRPKNRPRG